MKRFFFLLLLAGTLAGCEAPLENTVYTTWRGGDVPEGDHGDRWVAACEEFQKVVDLVENNKGKEIDDEDFVEKLSTKTFYAKNRYWHLKGGPGESYWSYVYGMPGGVMTSKLYFENNGTLFEGHYIEYWVSTYGPTVVQEMLDYFAQYDCVGYYTSYEWSYDAATHTLKTTVSGLEREAEVLYYDGTTAILLGDIATLGHGNASSFIEELYQVEFPDKEAGYLEGLLPADEFYVLKEGFDSAYD